MHACVGVTHSCTAVEGRRTRRHVAVAQAQTHARAGDARQRGRLRQRVQAHDGLAAHLAVVWVADFGHAFGGQCEWHGNALRCRSTLRPDKDGAAIDGLNHKFLLRARTHRGDTVSTGEAVPSTKRTGGSGARARTRDRVAPCQSPFCRRSPCLRERRGEVPRYQGLLPSAARRRPAQPQLAPASGTRAA